MKNFFYKYIFFVAKILLFIIPEIKSQDRKTDKTDDKDIPDDMELLENLKIEIKEITKEIAKYDTLIYILIPNAIFYF
jgi:hypothetical protein